MKNTLIFQFLTLLCVFTLTGCSPDTPEVLTTDQPQVQTPDTPEVVMTDQPQVQTPVTPEPAAEVAAKLPEVIVLYGDEDFVPWLESENWWGPVNREEQLTVPHVIITAIHPSWKEFSSTLPVQVKKGLFYRLMAPLVMHANLMVTDFREGLFKARDEFATEGVVSSDSLMLLKRLAFLLPGMTDEGVAEITADHAEMANMLDVLLYRVDIIPAGLALGQAAYESGYGTSRFATEGNSLFGQWTYKGDGIKPKEQRTGSKGDHRIKAFEWPFDSVRGYFINLSSHPAYAEFRQLRADLKAAGKPVTSMALADGLIRYSERGQEYVDTLKGIMRVNKLDIADDAVFRDEPRRFIIGADGEAAAVELRREVEQLRQSGELADIIARMRLD
jgi:Bax protein